MTAFNQNDELFSGESRIYNISITDEKGKIPDMSGAKFTYKMGSIQKSGTIIDTTNGIVQVILNSSDIKNTGNYKHELKMVDVDGNESIVMDGMVTIKRSIL